MRLLEGHAATTAPPRRGSPAPASAPDAGSRRTACAPPKNTLRSSKLRELPALGGECVGTRARLGVDDPVLPVHARRLDGVDQAEPAVDHPEDHLQDRRADAVGARRPEREHHLAVAHHHRRGHHRRQPPPRRVGEEAERRQVLLAHHVVEVDAGARHDHARALAVRARHRARPPVAVEHRDVRRRAELRAHELVEEARPRETLEELLACAPAARTPSRRRAATGSAARARGRAARARRR